MRYLLFVFSLVFSSVALGDGLYYSHLLVSEDTDNNSLWYNESGVWLVKDESFDIGTSVRYTNFENGQSTRLGFLFDKRFEQYGISGDLGFDELLSGYTGKASISRWFNNGSIKLNHERGIVDSALGVSDEITFNIYYLEGQVSWRNNTLVGIIGTTRYSDSIDNDWFRLIGTVPINNNFNLVAQYRRQEFSGDSIYYFSPSEYDRFLYGISTYYDLTENMYFRGLFLYGNQQVLERSEESYLLRASLHYQIPDTTVELKLELLSDTKEVEYTYNQVMLNVIFRF